MLVSGANLHNIKCFYATIYLVENNKPIFNHLCILNDDVTPEIWKSVMIKLLYPKQKVVVFLTIVTIYLICIPKPDKDNTCTTIHSIRGDTPLRTAYRPISALCIVYRHVLASRTAYRLTTKQPFFGNFIYIKKIKWKYEGDTPSPLAYCVPPYFGLAYCVPPFFGIAYCVPFNNKNNHFWRFHLHKEDKMTVCCMHMHNHSSKR